MKRAKAGSKAPPYLQYEAQSRQERAWDEGPATRPAHYDRPDSPGRWERDSSEAPPRQQTVDNRLPGLPRYARINTLLTTLGAVRRSLAESGHVLLDWTSEAALSGGGGGRACRRDEHVPDLLVFKPKGQSDISRVPMVARGELVVQQKASCFPGLALAPPPGAHVIDGCAAPGNKTTHLAALMEDRGSLLAFEQDARRCALLEQMLQERGATCARAIHGSFLDADPTSEEHELVSHILLDPSCSSSGMSLNPVADPAALAALAAAQMELVLHAMRFPNLQALVYSTCSIHEVENERVVAQVLAANEDFELDVALPHWPRRGRLLSDEDRAHTIARCTVRSQYPDDETIGFYLARFVRKGSAQKAKQAGVPSAGYSDAGLVTKLDHLARARKKLAKARAAEGTVAAAGSARKQPAQPAKAAAKQEAPAAGGKRSAAAGGELPLWRLERDAKKKKKNPSSSQSGGT